MKVVSSEAMARIDSRSQSEYGFPSTLLMEDAGVKAWAAARRIIRAGRVPESPLLFVAGRGNNGGDALVMARQAVVEGAARVAVVFASGRPGPDSDPGRMLGMCAAMGIECLDWPAQADHVRARLAAAGWIFDGIAGTGMRGALRSPVSDLVAELNGSPARRIALDVPSGVSDGFRADHPAVRADVTLTMGLPKLCLYLPHARTLCGRITVVPVGFPRALVEDPSIPGELLRLGAWRSLAPAIPSDTHKGMRGHLAVFAGSRGTTGAAWLSATAAARSRVGLVTLFTDADAYAVTAAKLTSVMCRPWDVSADAWDASRFSAVLAGPGWGLGEAKERWLGHLLSLPVKGVIDADGISLLARMASRGKVDLAGRWVLTPHPGEFSRLAGVPREEILADPVPAAAAASARLNGVIVLKGHTTIVAAPDGRYWILDASNPALATAGSGDVLAGLIGGGVAGGMGPLDAALFGVSLHATVARAAARRIGWFLAEDLVPLVSRVLR